MFLPAMQATIMKPGTLIGTEDRILNRWAQFAKKWSFLPLMGGGSTRYYYYFTVYLLFEALPDNCYYCQWKNKILLIPVCYSLKLQFTFY